jgi:mono/diheme cytochrome c family protein
MRARVLCSIAALTMMVTTCGCKKSEAATAESRELFVNACARCHGQDGAGGLPLYAGGPSPRNFRDHAFQQSVTDEQLKTTIRSGKGTGMPPFGATFDEGQLAALVVQIRSFDPERK